MFVESVRSLIRLYGATDAQTGKTCIAAYLDDGCKL